MIPASVNPSSGVSSGSTNYESGINIGGIQTGGTQGLDLKWIALGAVAVVVVLLLLRK